MDNILFTETDIVPKINVQKGYLHSVLELLLKTFTKSKKKNVSKSLMKPIFPIFNGMHAK